MGLTIHFELRLPGTTPQARVVELLQQLSDKASTLNLDHVLPILDLSVEQLMSPLDKAGPDIQLEWLFHMLASGVRESRDGSDAATYVAPDELAALAFTVCPGEGCELAMFGFVRPLSNAPPADAADYTEHWSDWFWYHASKTQYASAVSDEHFIHCHLALVALLDEASRLGIGVRVSDETGYWESRSIEQLLAELHRMNRLIAHFAGAVHDAIGDRVSVEGEIFHHPDFERLESKPLRSSE